jgi:Protein of unknown function (DUF2809)
MTKILRFKKRYFILAVLLFMIEVYIAIYVHDDVIRPYIGDFLVVMLIYCFVRAFADIPVLTACILVLIFSFMVELLQYFQLVKLLGLQESTIAKTVLGNSFAWTDLAMYTAGVVAILCIERVCIMRNKKAGPGSNS